MELSFLVVYGGWLWPVVGVALVAATYVIVRRRQRGSKVAAPTRLVSRVPTPVIAAVMMAMLYGFGLWGIGTALVSDDPIDQYEPSNDPSVASRLAWAAATPMRKTALEQLWVELAPATRQPGVVAARVQLLDLMGGHCERAAQLLLEVSHYEEALARAKRCEQTADVLELVEEANLGLARFPDAASALERRADLLAGKHAWTMDELAVLAMARHWKALERAATSVAAVQKPSPFGDALECVALIARYRGGDAGALGELRARPFDGARGLCRMFAADTTGSLADLQALTAFPLEPSDLVTKDSGDPPAGDAAAAYTRFLDESTGKTPPAPPYSLAPSADTEAVARDVHGPESWRGPNLEGQGDHLEELRLLVLATHAPGEPLDLLYPTLNTHVDYLSLSGDGPLLDPIGMRVRAARALWPYHATGIDTANALVPLLYTAAELDTMMGEHARADAHIAAAIDLERSLGLQPYELDSAHGNASLATMTALLRRGDVDRADAILKRVSSTTIYHDPISSHYDMFDDVVAAARGDHDAMEKVASRNLEPQRAAIDQALAGDGRGLAQLSLEGVSHLRIALPFLFRHVKDRSVLRDLVRTTPQSAYSPRSAFEQLCMQLHLADAAADEDTVRQLRARVAAYIEAYTAADTALVLDVLTMLHTAG